jgi:hypothetical protein
MKTEVKITFTVAPHYRLLAATGVWGGPTPNGEIVIDFVVDRAAPPDYVTVEVDEFGNAKEKPIMELRTIRERQVGIVMRPDIALAIGNFLIEKSNLLLKKPGGLVQ